MGRNGTVVALSNKLLAIVATALGSILALVFGIIISATIDIRTSMSRIEGSLPHIQERINRIDRRLQALERRANDNP